MPFEIFIDGRAVSVSAGETILEAARRAGAAIPTLCRFETVDAGGVHPSSCLVCVVKDEASGKLVPACDTRVSEGLRVSTASDELAAARRKHLELLLSEHVGDCGAPCVTACPIHGGIPASLAAAYRGDDAAALRHFDPASREPFPCEACPGYCERPCRRRDVDASTPLGASASVPIRRILIEVKARLESPCHPRDASTSLSGAGGDPLSEERSPLEQWIPASAGMTPKGSSPSYHHRLGHIRPEEREAALARSLERRIPIPDSPHPEAGACLQCACLRERDCELRSLAAAFGAKSGAFRVGERDPIEAPLFLGPLAQEHGKCVKCGRCVRLGKKAAYDVRPVFAFRGYKTRVLFPDHAASMSLETAKAYAEACPTGALASNPFPPQAEGSSHE